MRSLRSLRSRGAALTALTALSLLGCGGGGGGGGGSTLGVTFTESATALAPRVVKLVQKSKSGARVIVDVVIGGPDASLDMFSFAFDVKIGDGTIVKFVSGSGKAGNALVATAGQSIQALVKPSASDATDIVVGVTKLGPPPGNGIAGNSAVVVEMAFDVVKAGATTLAITGSGANPPTCLDSQSPPQPIPSVTFDLSSATIKGVSS